ncbi:MAG: endopeptidase La [Lachnospiraceae bacterium]|nr:endopeptidase La [Lachnospiraceae bacterium]
MRRTSIRSFNAAILQNIAILPGEIVFCEINGVSSIEATKKALANDEGLLLMIEKDGEDEEGNPIENTVYEIGVVSKVRQISRSSENSARVLFEGVERAKLVELKEGEHIFEAKARYLTKKEMGKFNSVTEAAMRRNLEQLLDKFLKMNSRVSDSFLKKIRRDSDIDKMIDVCASNIPMEFDKKLGVLQLEAIEDRYAYLMSVLVDEMGIMKLRGELSQKLEDKINENQKKYILEEQIRLIREELGDNNPESEADNYLKELEELQASDEVKESIRKEIERFKNIPSGSSESTVEQLHIEALLKLPWDKASEENNSLENAEKILKRDHYGLEKVKDRILEFLAVRNLTEKGQTPIICLIGPPGTGKTSIAKSLAEAMGRKYFRISLGGVRDEAEIRGHRKTYIGAMPGMIANGLERVGVKNPLMLLDEIDKLSSDYHGATASALLEVLDSEQNKTFRDHYIEVPIDLSDVFFIATANSKSDIPGPLLDRLEVIDVSGYTENEKFHIAKEHLVKKQLIKNGLTRKNLVISDSAIRSMISLYTREAGVRSLERKIGEICRKSARKVYEDREKKISVTAKNLSEFLGKEKYLPEDRAGKAEVGLVRGLAWTSVGGVTLEIEVNLMPGKGNLMLTGQLGDVMKESAQAGLTYIKSICDKMGVNENFFKSHDIHIHIPEGATPKDGPSAGVTMATAMASALTGIPARGDIAMTGEVTLRGRVLPIGGLKEKLLAAKAVGINEVLVPVKNKSDVEEISDEIKDGMDIKFMTQMDEIFKIALTKEFTPLKEKSSRKRASK